MNFMKLSKKQKITAAAVGLCLLAAAAPVLAFHLFPEKEKSVVIYDHGSRQTIKTKASDVSGLLKEQKITLSGKDTYWSGSSRVRDGSVIVIERAIPVTILSNGNMQTVETTQQTVRGALIEAGVDLQSEMPLENEMQSLHPGMQIHLIPYTVRTVSRTVSIPVHYENFYDSTMSPDQEVVVREGRAGKKIVNREEYISNGKIIKTEIVNGDVIDPGVPGMERSGSPENAAGWMQTMEATAYNPLDGDGRGITAAGTKAAHGTVAVDPHVIPLGSRVYIPDYGDAVATDTGRVILGNRIDLCMDTYAECWSFGRQPVDVYIRY